MSEETSLINYEAPGFAGEGKTASGEAPITPPPDRRLTLTSHSIKIDAGLFSLDLSWRRLEMDPKESGEAERPQKAIPMAPPSFAEILRRQQIADLLAPLEQPPPDCELLMASQQTPPPMIPVRLAYPGQDRPLAGLRSLRSSTV